MTSVSLSARQKRSSTTSELLERASSADEPERSLLLDDVVQVNMGVARSVAHRYRGRGETDEDLEQVAYLGLVKAARGFDCSRGKDFLTYAVPTVDGELKRYFRDRAWMIRPPRRIQMLQSRISAALDALVQQHGRSPTVPELAAYLGADEEDVIEALSADGCFTPASLDMPVGSDGSSVLGDLVHHEERGYEQVEAGTALAPLLQNLEGRDAFIIRRRFVDLATQREIAGDLGITQMQVSRLITRILGELRGLLD